MNNNELNNEVRLPPIPSVFDLFGISWRQMWKYFLELLLLTIISIIILLPTSFLENNGVPFLSSNPITINLLFISFSGVGAVIFFATIYLFLFQWPLEYGISYVNLQVARGKKAIISNIFLVYKNYWNAVFANLLVAFIIGFGIVMLIVPGLIFACKLVFVPYLIVEQKMEAVDAVKTSWKISTGYTGKIFLMGILSIFIIFLGLLFFGIGITVSLMWNRLTFAYLYKHVSQQKGYSVQA